MNDVVSFSQLIPHGLSSALLIICIGYTWSVDRRIVRLTERLDALFHLIERGTRR